MMYMYMDIPESLPGRSGIQVADPNAVSSTCTNKY